MKKAKKVFAVLCALVMVFTVLSAAPIVSKADTLSPQWVAKQAMYSGSISGTPSWRDFTEVYFDTLGKNLITDPTVSEFENGVYSEYYNWETRDASVPVNPKAWWDRPAIKYNGFEMETIQPRYSSARYSGYVSNDPTLSHTPDGSGVLKVVRTSSKSYFLPLAPMKTYSYYTIAFWLRVKNNVTDFDGLLKIQNRADGDIDIISLNQARIVQLKSGWVQYVFLVYTGNNSWTQPALLIPGGNTGTEYYFDDFSMYKLDESYGAACMEAGYMLPTPTDNFSTSPTSFCLNMKNNVYKEYYENIDWSEYGKSVCPDPTVARFTNGVYSNYYVGNYSTTVTDKLAMWDKPANDYQASIGETYWLSANDRGFVTADTSYSHTNDGSGAIFIPATVKSNGTKTAPSLMLTLPSFEKFSYYVVCFWVKNPDHNWVTLQLNRNSNGAFSGEPFFSLGAATQVKDDKWQRVTFFVYTGSSTYSTPYLPINGINDAVIDEIEVWKLDDEEFAAACLAEKRLIVPGDLGGADGVDTADLVLMRKQLLNLVNIPIFSTDVNGDGVVDIRDFIRLKKKLASVPESYYKYCDTAMLNASVLYEGDTTRLSAKIKAALNDKSRNTKIAVL